MGILSNAANLGASNSDGAGAPTRVIGDIHTLAADLKREGARAIACSTRVRENKNGNKMILLTVDDTNFIVNTGRSVSLGDEVSDLTFGEFLIEGNTVLLAYKPGSADVMSL